MATIHADGTAAATPRCLGAGGTSLRGYITTSYTTLVRLFGEPDWRPDSFDSDETGWVIRTPVGIATVYAICPGGPPRCPHSRWRVGGHDDVVLPWVYQAVTGSTETFPTGAREFFADSTLGTFAAAYADYLYLRMRAAIEWLNTLDRRLPVYRSSRYLPQQYNIAASEVRDAVLDYLWAVADDTERRTQAGTSRPLRGSRHGDLEYWHTLTRWLYTPTPGITRSPVSDLSAALLDLADRKAADRNLLAAVNPDLHLDVYDQHQRTLRALATTLVAGLDSLWAGGSR